MTPPAGAPGRWVVLHDVEHVQAVAEIVSAGTNTFDCITAPSAAAYAGVGYLGKMVRAGGAGRASMIDVVLDCGDDAGLVLGAIRQGWCRIAFVGTPDVADRLRAIAEAAGSALLSPPPTAGRLDLVDATDPAAALRDWLAR